MGYILSIINSDVEFDRIESNGGEQYHMGMSSDTINIQSNDNLKLEQYELLMHQVMKGDKGDIGTLSYISLERLRPYLYRVTFDSLPEDTGSDIAISGGCSSFVLDGKLYRNLDFNYDNAASFIVRCHDFEGMSFVTGLNDGSVTNELVAKLPYRIVDGRNNYGIMVSTHILFNDWSWSGCGQKNIPLTKLPYLVLTHVKSMATISQDLSGIINNLAVTESLSNFEYLIQILVTDGTTTYALLPPLLDNQPYVLQNITSNPKLTNFRWVNSAIVTRNQLQTRPTGVERWNMIPCELSDLRFTLAYESASRLSEFIGINGTTKESTDFELLPIYNSAHALYIARTRNGETWHTMHSVIYGDRMEKLYIQENWDDNCISSVPDIDLSGYVTRVEHQQDITELDTELSEDIISGITEAKNYAQQKADEAYAAGQQDLEDAKELIDATTDALDARLTSVDADLTEQIDAAKDRITEAEEQIEEAEGKIQDAEGKIQDVEDRLATAEEDISDAQVDINTAKGQIAAHTSTLSVVNQSLTTLDARMDSAEGTIELHGETIDTIEETVSEVGVTLDAHAASIALNASRIDTVEGTVAEAELDIDGANARITAQATRIDTLTGRVTQAELDIDGAEASITAQASRVDTLTGRVTQAELDIDGAEGSISLLASSVETAEGNITSLGTRMSSAEGSITTFANWKSTATGQLTTMESKWDAINATIDTEVATQLSKAGSTIQTGVGQIIDGKSGSIVTTAVQNVTTNIDGILNTSTKISQLTQDTTGIKAIVGDEENGLVKDVATLNLTTQEFSTRITNTEDALDDGEGNLLSVSEIKQTADEISLAVTNGDNYAAIVARINDATGTSEVLLNASKIYLLGETVAEDLTAIEATIGNLTLTNADVSGIIRANQLILGQNVTIPYSKISRTPDLTVYISKGGVIGQTPGPTTTGFVVSSAGLLQAANAVIYGTIYATAGKIGGWSISNNNLVSGNVSIAGSGSISNIANNVTRWALNANGSGSLANGNIYWNENGALFFGKNAVVVDEHGVEQASLAELISNISTILSWFELDQTNNAIKTKGTYNFYSNGQICAGGYSSSSGGGGGTVTAISVDGGTPIQPTPGTTVINLPLGLSSISTNAAHGQTAYSWGNHASAGYLTSYQTLYALTLQAGAFTAGIYTPNSAAKTINIPTTTSHISEGSNLYFTNARAISATDGTYLKLTGGVITGSVRMNGSDSTAPFVRNFTLTVSSGWSRRLADFEVDGHSKFSISAFGSYVPGATDNGITYAYLGCNGYDGLNLRINATELKWGNSPIYHSDNSNKSTVDWAAKDMTVSGALRIGNYILSVDSTAGALKLSKSDGTAAHFFTTGQMSAGGFSSSGSGGGTVTAIRLGSGTTPIGPTPGTTIIDLDPYPTATSLGLKALAYKASLTSSEVISYLGYTPYNAANISGASVAYATSAGELGYGSKLTDINDAVVHKYYIGAYNASHMPSGASGYISGFTFSIDTATAYAGQFGIDSVGNAFIRSKRGGTWYDWNTIYHSGNFVAGTNYVTPSGLTSALSGYVSKSGGDVISGTTAYPLTLNTTNSANYLDLEISGTRSGRYGFNTGTIGVYLQNLAVTGTPYVNIASDGVFKYNGSYPFYHSGNFVAGTNYVSPSGLTSALAGYLPLSGGTMTGDIVLPSESSDWNFGRYESKFRLVACRGTAATGAPGTYYAGMSAITTYVGFQLVTYGGATDDLKFRKLDENGTWHNWYNIYHSGNSNNTSTAWSASSLTLNGAITGATSITASGVVTCDSVQGRSISAYDSATGFFFGSAKSELGTSHTGALVYAYGSNPIYFYTNGSERMKIDGSGNATIGGSVSCGNFATSGNIISTKTDIVYIGASASAPIGFVTGWTNRMTITATGSVGIGTATIPSTVKLYVSGNFAATGNVAAGTYTSSSDRKFKDNISLMTDDDAIALIKALKPSSWDWNELSHIEGRGHGFVAQEVSPYLPESVKEIDGHLTLNYTDLHAFEVKALQCHESRIERLERENRELKAKVADLTKRLNA